MSDRTQSEPSTTSAPPEAAHDAAPAFDPPQPEHRQVDVDADITAEIPVVDDDHVIDDDIDDDVDTSDSIDIEDAADDDLDGPLTFADLGLSDDLLASLDALGYVIPTPIQAESIPPLLDGFDLLGQAATGTGKTAAFALPMLDRVAGAKRSKLPFGLVLVPTRELANQVAEAMKEYGAQGRVRMAALFGGTNIGPQFSLLNAGVDIVIGTPGRVLDHLKRGSLDLSNCGMVVLDEADEMLDMGFAEDLEAILEAAPPERQTVLFSATMPNRIDSIATRQLSDPVRISIQRATDTEGTMPKVTQRAYLTHRTHRASALGRILDMESPEAAIVFCRTRGDVDELTDVMNGRGYRAEALHGGMSQDQRDRAMGRLKSGVATLLIATDVAARGIDVDHLSHVVNYDIPQTTEAYTHRIGRVGRAGREGIAITLGGPKDHRKINNIARYTKQNISIEKVPTVNDLTMRRMQQTGAEVAAKIGDTESADLYRTIVEQLTAEHDPVEVAIAAVRLAHESAGRTSSRGRDPRRAGAIREGPRSLGPRRPQGSSRSTRRSWSARRPRTTRRSGHVREPCRSQCRWVTPRRGRVRQPPVQPRPLSGAATGRPRRRHRQRGEHAWQRDRSDQDQRQVGVRAGPRTTRRQGVAQHGRRKDPQQVGSRPPRQQRVGRGASRSPTTRFGDAALDRAATPVVRLRRARHTAASRGDRSATPRGTRTR